MSIDHVSIIKKSISLYNTELSTKAPIDYHPDVLFHRDEDANNELRPGAYDYRSLFDIDDNGTFSHSDGSYAFEKAHEALHDAYTWHTEVAEVDAEFQKTHNLELRNKQNFTTYPTLSPHGNGDLYEAAVELKKQKDARIAQRLDSLVKFQTKLNDVINKAMELPELVKPHGVALATEIRSYVRGLKGSEQTTFLNRMIQGGERFTMAAVLKAPFFLSGLTREAHFRYDVMAMYTFSPREARQRDAVNRLVHKVEGAQRSMDARLAELQKTVGAVSVQRAKANKALAALKARSKNMGNLTGPLAKGNS